MADFTNRSFGILLESADTALANSIKTSAYLSSEKYAGLRAEAPLEVADKLIHDPLEEFVIEPATYYTIPIDRALVYISCSDPIDPVVNSGYVTMPNGVMGQRLTIYFAGDGHLEFPDSGNLNLSATRNMNEGDILELVSVNGQWHEVSYSAN